MAPDSRAGAGAGDGGRLLALLREFPSEGYERSFKMTAGALFAERVLLGIPRSAARDEALVRACEALSMPVPFLDAFRNGLPGADTVHFGYERAGASLLYKVYLEFARRLEGASAGVPLLLHLAYKWEPRDPGRRTLARYECIPGLTIAQILARLAQTDGPAAEVAGDIVALAAERASEPLMYLDVKEDENARLSFDVNVHAAGMRLREVEPQLRSARQRFGVPRQAFEQLWDRIESETLGHVAGGRGRDGVAFLTLYHAVAAP